MAHRATWDESKDAVDQRERRRSLAESVWNLRRERWSHALCMAIYDGGPLKETFDLFMQEMVPNNGRHGARVEAAVVARAIVRVAHDEEEPREHGFIYRQNCTSGRKRRDAKPVLTLLSRYRYDPA